MCTQCTKMATRSRREKALLVLSRWLCPVSPLPSTRYPSLPPKHDLNPLFAHLLSSLSPSCPSSRQPTGRRRLRPRPPEGERRVFLLRRATEPPGSTRAAGRWGRGSWAPTLAPLRQALPPGRGWATKPPPPPPPPPAPSTPASGSGASRAAESWCPS